MRRTNSSLFKVAVMGAAGGIGQPLSLLLKQSPLVSHLALYDIVGTPGVAADLSHVNAPSKTTGHLKDDAKGALDGAEVVVIPAGVPRKPGMTRDDLFNTNASIVQALAKECATHCPKAKILIISNPVNSTVPIAAEALKAAGVYDPTKLFGVSTLDVVRANTFVAQCKSMNPFDINVTVVGGHSGPTIVPLLSHLSLQFTEEEVKALTKRIQYGGDEVVKAKDGAGSATLSMAHAGAEMAFAVLKASRGDKGLTECTFVQSPVMTEANPNVDFFSSRVELGKQGIEKIHPVGALSDFEQGLMKECLAELEKNIAKGKAFGKH